MLTQKCAKSPTAKMQMGNYFGPIASTDCLHSKQDRKDKFHGYCLNSVDRSMSSDRHDLMFDACLNACKTSFFMRVHFCPNGFVE